MLVLARQRDQSLIIGDDIEVIVVDVRGDKVRLGINAPRNVSVHRKEVYELIREENRAAARLVPNDLQGQVSVARPALRIQERDTEVAVSRPASGTNGHHDHRPFLKAAIDEARMGLAEGGVPIGSVLVRDGEIIGRGHNRRVQNKDPMAHAEIDCLTRAGRQSGGYKDTVLYSTLMPCYLCSGAVVQFGIPTVVVGESETFPGAPAFMRDHGARVIDLHDPECISMMSEFIRSHPELWNEDIGKI